MLVENVNYDIDEPIDGEAPTVEGETPDVEGGTPTVEGGDTVMSPKTKEQLLKQSLEEKEQSPFPDYMIDLIACNTEVKPLPTSPFKKTEAEMVEWMKGKDITPRKAGEVAAYIKGNWPGPRKTWKDVAAVFRTLVVKTFENSQQPTGTGTRRSRTTGSLPATDELKKSWG